MTDLAPMIEARLAETEPDVELLLVERSGPDALRLFIDHPEGVDLALCERVTAQLSDLLRRYSLEVSSPGLDRPLTKPEHFRRFLGKEVRLRTDEAIAGQRNFRGTLAAVDDLEVSLERDEGSLKIPHSRIERATLVPELPGGNA